MKNTAIFRGSGLLHKFETWLHPFRHMPWKDRVSSQEDGFSFSSFHFGKLFSSRVYLFLTGLHGLFSWLVFSLFLSLLILCWRWRDKETEGRCGISLSSQAPASVDLPLMFKIVSCYLLSRPASCC